MITIRYTTIDRFSQTRRFKTLKGARAYARRMMGRDFDISETFGYAVSGDGVGKITVDGVALDVLMAPEPVSDADVRRANSDFKIYVL